MDATYQTLAAAGELGEFTVALLAKTAGVKATTVRTVLNRHRHLFEQRTAESGRRGGQPQIWIVRDADREQLQAIVSKIATRFDEDQSRRFPEPDDGDLKRPLTGRLRVSSGNPELAVAEDLEAFAPHLAARELLPHMVRRLLEATPGVTGVSIRAGDGIGLPGFDGRADFTVGSPHVPAGPSVWELGTSANPQAKAQEDFRRRTDNPGDVDPAHTTFVAVSLRRFFGKEDWAARCRAKHTWRDVRVIDADDLYGWLEEHPQVHTWVSEQLGLRPSEVATLRRWWEFWLSQTEPPTPGELLLSGRRSSAVELRKSLRGDAQAVGVYAGSREEATAFTAGALLIDDPEDNYIAGDDPLSMALVVSTSRQWARLCTSGPGTVLIPDFEDADIASALRAGHPVVVPMGPSDDRARARIELPPIDREEAREVLRRCDPPLDMEEADRYAAHARRSLVSFRRSRAINPAYKSPAWAQRPAADLLAPLVLVGTWESESHADQAVVAAIAGQSYPDIERELRRPPVPDDPPFIRAGNRWQLTSPVDAWTLLRPLLTRAELQRWRAEAIRVLAEEDPASELPPEEQFLAPVRGIHREYSSALRKGLARAAALLSSDDRELAPDGQAWRDHSASIIRELLGDRPDPRRWAALEDVLPELAEAAPEVFLRSAAAGLIGADPALRGLFRDNDSVAVWESRSPHTGLLWALELLCWSDDYVADACDVLAGLAKVDPGGRLGNRPAASLRRVLLPWYPQTAASLESRVAIVTGILERRPEPGWHLLLGLMPQHFDSSHPNYRPVFRGWKSLAHEANFSERLEATKALVDVALRHLKDVPGRWFQFIEVLPNLPPTDLGRALGVLASVDIDGFSEQERLEIWRALVKLVSSHRQFPTAAWAMPASLIRRFEEIAARWEPFDVPERHSHLFDWHPDLPGTDKFDHAAYEAALAEARREVIGTTLAANGDDGLTRLMAEAPIPGLVGATVAEVAGDALDERMVAALDRDGPERLAATGWVIRMSELHAPEWVDAMLKRASQLSERGRVALYLALPNEPRTWDAVDSDTPAVADRFWQSTRTLTVRPEHAVVLVGKLLDHRRPWSAVDLLAHHSHRPDISAELIERTLRTAAGPDIDEPHPAGSIDYDLGVLLDQLEARDGARETLIELEWLYFAPLQHTRSPKSLFGALADNPSVFVELICAAFRPAGEPKTTEADAAEIARARQAFLVLRAWRRPPGLHEDGSIDGDALRIWVTEARRLLAQADRASIGDECIGEVLSGAPPGADGIWPAEPVRALLEAMDSQSLGQGLAIGKFNARGVTSRGVFDGGRQEDALADQYEAWSKQVMARWPETGRLLREMGRSYRSWARRQDAMSEEWANAD